MSPEIGMDQGSFLAMVRVALKRRGASAPRPDVQVARADWAERARRIQAEALDRWEELLARFSAELEAVAGVVHRAAPAGIPALVARIARERQLSRVVTWSEPALGLPDLVAHLRAEGLEVEDGSPHLGRPATSEAVETIRRRLDRGEVGLTGADYAVADSGSLVLVSGPGKGRLVSCLPLVHVAILRPGQLVAGLAEVGVLLEALHRQAPPADFPSSVTFITGPSRTADIELSLTRGVHGPKELHVICLER